MEVSQYLSMFIEESKEHLQAMNENLLSLENNPQDIGIVQHIFRSAHTLKGMSATMGFQDLASLTHEMENVLDLVRNHKLNMDAFIFDCIFKSLDSLETMVEDIVQGGPGKADVSEIVAALQSIVSGDNRKQASASAAPATASKSVSGMEVDQYQYSVLQQSIDAGHMVFFIDVSIREDCVLKAARAYMAFDILDRHGEVVKSTPSVQDIEQEKFERSFSVYYISKVDTAALEQEILNISEIETAHVVQVDKGSLAEMVRGAKSGSVTSELIAQMEVTKQEVASASAAVAPDLEVGRKPVATATQQNAAPVANRTIRVDIERLDALMNLFSELLIDRGRLEQLAGEVKRSELTETVEHMSRVSSDLQSIVLKLRMVPVDSVFNRFPRMIRDVAKTLNKKVDLVISGAETELDRTVMDEIGDPLVHLLRNAVDHGIESIADRVAAGKNEIGTVHLRAFHSGNHVFIEVEEDGAGIHHEKVLKRALQNGLITQDQAAKMTEHEIAQLLFASGFSTADKISDISGRGVGLDVVKTKIQSLGGHVSVESKMGHGSKFSVQLPLTLSIISAMLIRLGSEKYAIPLSSIVETSAVEQSKIRHIHGNRMIEFRGMVIPVISLSEVLEVPDYNEANEAETEMVIIRKGEKIAALMVDEFIGQQEIVLKTLGKYLTNLFAISGATILGDGQVALIIDTNALVK
jgi:two-component system chemotaxis sensor kinase CheA